MMHASCVVDFEEIILCARWGEESGELLLITIKDSDNDLVLRLLHCTLGKPPCSHLESVMLLLSYGFLHIIYSY